MGVFHAERTRLVMAHETADILAADESDARAQLDQLLDVEWRLAHLSRVEAENHIDATRLIVRRAAESSAKYEVSMWRFFAIWFLLVAILKSVRVL